jgi:hypothetical protein
VVLARLDAPDRFLQVHGYLGAVADGDELDAEDWEMLQASSQAMRLQVPVPAQSAAALWLFRSNFMDHDEALGRLSASGALLHREEVNGTVAAVVREDRGNAVRDVLALERFDRASRAAQAGLWPEALSLANLSFVLGRG